MWKHRQVTLIAYNIQIMEHINRIWGATVTITPTDKLQNG